MAKRKKKPGKEPEIIEVKNPKLLSVTRFAEAVNRGTQVIYGHMKNGTLSYTLVNGVKKIDLEKGKAELAAHLDPNPRGNKPSLADGTTPQDLGKETYDVLSDATQREVPQGALTYVQAKAYREAFTARQKELEFKIKSGQVIEKAQVEKAAFEVARIARETILGIPDKIAAELAAEPDVQRVHFLLREALLQTLETIAEENLFKENRSTEIKIEGPASNEPPAEPEENED